MAANDPVRAKKRVVVAMSGGVDSSVAAYLLSRQGYEVIGVTMRLWTVEREGAPPLSRRCCSVEDVDDARRVCQILGLPHYVLNFEREFQRYVVDYFCQEYDRGRTPHPCLACNDRLKFDFLLRRALFLGADYVATGHYARVRDEGGRYRLLKGADPAKDQSYVLFTLGQRELSRLLLPVGEHRKEEVRRMAREAGLPVADKPDSQEICFIPDGDYRSFVARRLRPKPGPVVDTRGALLGQHPGIQFFTVGQRRGLGIKASNGRPLYVVRIDARTNTIVVGHEEELYRRQLWASSVNFLGGEPPSTPVEAMVKIRYKSQEQAAIVEYLGRGWARVVFHEPQRAVTPGQAVVFYSGDEVLGGGYIETEAPALAEAV